MSKNRNNSNYSTSNKHGSPRNGHEAGTWVPDHGPATVALVWPYAEKCGSELAKAGLRRIGLADHDGDDVCLHGYMVVKSRLENYSVRELTLSWPRLRDAGEDNGGAQLRDGPRIRAVRAVRYECGCPEPRTIDQFDLVRESTVEKRVRVEKDGRSFWRNVRVAKDDQSTVVYTLKDLHGHRVTCPICGCEATKCRPHRWALDDEQVVDESFADKIREAMSEPGASWKDVLPEVVSIMPIEACKAGCDVTRHPQLVAKILADNQDLAIRAWDSAIKTGEIGVVGVVVPEISVFSVDDVQQLRELKFGQKDRLCYSGDLSFQPKDRFISGQPICTIGDAVKIQIGDLQI